MVLVAPETGGRARCLAAKQEGQELRHDRPLARQKRNALSCRCEVDPIEVRVVASPLDGFIRNAILGKTAGDSLSTAL